MSDLGKHGTNRTNKVGDEGTEGLGGGNRFNGRAQGPHGGQGPHGYSARLSDRGEQGGAREGGRGQELGSHGGRRREHQNPGPDHGRKDSDQ